MTRTATSQQPLAKTTGREEPRDSACRAAYRAIRVLRILERRTGEGKGVALADIIEELENPNDDTTPPVASGKKAVFAAIAALRAAGHTIEYRRASGYHLMSRSLTDEEIVRLLAMLDRNRTVPADIRRSTSLHLAALASADISEHLDFGEHKVRKRDEPKPGIPRADIDPRELLERAVAQAMPVSFDITVPNAATGIARERCAMQPIGIRDQRGRAYLLGTVLAGPSAEEALRTVALDRMRNIECRLVDGTKLMAALDEADGHVRPQSIGEPTICDPSIEMHVK